MALNMMFGAETNEVNVNKQGALEALRSAQRNDNNAPDLAKLGNAVMGATKAFADAKVTTDANSAKEDYLNLIMSPGYRDASAAGRTEMLESVYSSENSKAYTDAFVGYSSGQYVKEYDKREDEIDKSWYNGTGAAQKSFEGMLVPDPNGEGQMVTNKELGKTPKDFVDWYASQRPRLEKTVISRALMGDAYDEMTATVLSTTNPDELDAAMLDIQDIKAPYQDPMFMTTKQKEGKEWINTKEVALNQTIKAKKAEFKRNMQFTIAQATGQPYAGGMNSYTVHPKQLDKEFKYVYQDNPGTYNTKINEYTKGYNDAQQSREFNTNYSIGQVHPELPNNSVLKNDRQKLVTQQAIQTFQSGDFSTFIDTINNEPGMGEEAGGTLSNMFYGLEDSEALKGFTQKLFQISKYPNGATALRQSISDDTYVDMVATAWLSNSLLKDKTTTQVRDYVNQAKGNIEKIPMDPNLYKKVAKYATRLGKQSQGYMAVINKLHQIDPSLVKDHYKDVQTYFENQVGEVNGIQEDKSMGVIRDTIDPEKTVELLTDNLTKELGVTPTSITHIGDVTFGVDEFSGIGAVTSNRYVADESDKIAIEEAAVAKEKLKVDMRENAFVAAKVGAKAFGRTVADNLGGFVVNFHKPFGKMADRFGQHLIDSMDPYSQEFFGVGKFSEEAIREKNKDNIYIPIEEAIDEKIKTLPTTVPEVPNNTLNTYDEETLRNSLLNNKKKVSSLKDFKLLLQAERLKDKIASVESSNSYTAVNPTSGAYGKYQFIPEVAEEVAKELRIPIDEWKYPENQEVMFNYLVKRNSTQLERAGIPINLFSIYGAHQQGAKGFIDIMSGKPLSATRIDNMRSNMGGTGDNLKDSEIPDAWKQHWIEKLNS